MISLASVSSMMHPIEEAVKQLVAQDKVTQIKGVGWTVYRTAGCIRIDIHHQQGE